MRCEICGKEKCDKKIDCIRAWEYQQIRDEVKPEWHERQYLLKRSLQPNKEATDGK